VDGRWKTHLRKACDSLAEEVDEIYTAEAKSVGIDPWELRNRYIEVILKERSADALMAEMIQKAIPTEANRRLSLLLEAELHRQKMYTSCAWFFGEFSRLEPQNCLAYAAQAVVLVHKAVGVDLAPAIRGPLGEVVSHRNGLRGEFIFDRQLERALKR
jgi:hypothetical protein